MLYYTIETNMRGKFENLFKFVDFLKKVKENVCQCHLGQCTGSQFAFSFRRHDVFIRGNSNEYFMVYTSLQVSSSLIGITFFIDLGSVSSSI